MPQISIITTTYNHQDFIWDTIQSILNQTISDRELLIGDDSPGEETRKVIEWYIKKYPDKIKARHHSPNKGIVDNMNFLIDKIVKESEYIAFLEWDDMREKNYLKKKLEIFTKYPEVIVVYNNLDFIDKENTVIQKDIFTFRRIKTYQNKKIAPNDYVLADVWPIISWSTSMIKKDICKSYKIRSLSPEDKSYGIADYDFFFQIATKYPVYYINQWLTLYRRHQTNLSWSNPKVMEEISKLIKNYYKQNLITKTTYNKKMSHNNLIQSIIYLGNWNKKKSISHWKDALRHNRSNNIIMKLWILWLLCLPKKISKKILAKIIKRG